MSSRSTIELFMRTARALVFCALTVALFTGSVGRTAEQGGMDLTAEEKAWIQANPTIRVHNETNWPPFNFAVEGKPQGYSIDFMNLLAKRTGLKIDYITGPTWNQFLAMMKAGSLDVMLNIVKTPDRQKYLLYTAPIADNPNSILSKKQNGYESLELLSGKTVSVPKGFFYEEILTREFPQIKLHLVKGTLESMKAVSFGKADAALGELAVFNHLIESHLMTGLVISGEVKLGDPALSLLNIATRKDLPVLASILRKAVASVTPEERNNIETKWISAQHGLGVDITLVLQLGGAVGIVVLLVVLWNQRLRRAVVAGRKLEEAQHTLLRAISSPILVVREDNGEILYINEAAAGGRPIAALIGAQAVNLYVDPSDRELFLERMRSEQKVDGLEVLFNGSEGQIIWALVSSRLIVFGGHSSYLSTWTDITARRNAEAELRESEAGLKAFLEYANVPVIIKDLDLHYILVNRAFLDMRGVQLEDSLGKTANDFQPPDIAAKILEADRYVIESGKPCETEIKMFNAASEERIYFVIKYPVFADDGSVIALGSMFTDITERKQVEAELKAAKEEAERVAEAKSDFIAVISHEVRTPMNGVLGMARLMLEQPLLAEQRSQIKTIVDSSEALLTILNDLLDVSKLDAGKLELEAIPFATRSLIIETANVMASRAKEKGLVLEHEIAPNVPDALLGDANRLRQILLNLLSNAIKFTDHGKVTVAVRGVETLTGAFKLVLSVKDTGIGISTDEAKKLFSPYYQATVDIARERGGTGLGLSICRQLAELMGGEITLDSGANEGSTFTLTAPFDVTDHAPVRLVGGGSASGLNAQGPRLRILMVEDNLINRKVAQGMLAKLGHKVVTAENGKEALTRISKDDPFDIVLMDRHMPVMDGIEATRRIRAMDGPESTIPIIALTAAATTREIETCLESGMNDVVTKPIDPVQLKTVLMRVAVADGEIYDVGAFEAEPQENVAAGAAPVLDKAILANLRDEFGGDRASEFLDDFRGVVREGAAAFHRHAKAGDLDGMTHHSHDMKSCAAVIGLMRFSELCQKIELACIDADIDSAIQFGAGLEDELVAALDALSNTERTDGGEASIVQSPLIDKISHDLRNAMNTMFAYILLIQESSSDDLTVEQLSDYAGHIRSVGAQVSEMTFELTTSIKDQDGDRFSADDEVQSR